MRQPLPGLRPHHAGTNFAVTANIILSACITHSFWPLVQLIGWWGFEAYKIYRVRKGLTEETA